MTKQLDAIQLLKKDHQEVLALLEQLCASSSRAAKKRQTLLEKIGSELRAHTRIEEEIFYPAFREAAAKAEQRQLIAEAFEEHRAVEELVLPDLEETEAGGEQFAGRAKVLKEMVEHHAREEEKQMFPQAKKLFDKQQLQELGEQMAQRKEELVAQGV